MTFCYCQCSIFIRPRYCSHPSPLSHPTAISSLAELAQDSFASHYQSFMPGLKNILQSPAAAQMPTLRDQAMHAVAFIGGAVGREIFMPDAREVRIGAGISDFIPLPSTSLTRSMISGDGPIGNRATEYQAWHSLYRACLSCYRSYLQGSQRGFSGLSPTPYPSSAPYTVYTY